MSWLPENFFVPEAPEFGLRPNRPIGQGDVFAGVPVATKTQARGEGAQAQAKIETAMVVSSSCGMRKGADGALNPLLHLAPVKRLSSLAPNWGHPWEGHYHVLPLPGLDLDEEQAANLGRIGLASVGELDRARRMACVSEPGMAALKARLSMYFVRSEVPASSVEVGAVEEWRELDMWERWTAATGSEAGFQEWLDEPNANYPGRSRRESLYGDRVGIEEQMSDQVGEA